MPIKKQFLVFVGWLGFLCLAIIIFFFGLTTDKWWGVNGNGTILIPVKNGDLVACTTNEFDEFDKLIKKGLKILKTEQLPLVVVNKIIRVRENTPKMSLRGEVLQPHTITINGTVSYSELQSCREVLVVTKEREKQRLLARASAFRLPLVIAHPRLTIPLSYF